MVLSGLLLDSGDEGATSIILSIDSSFEYFVASFINFYFLRLTNETQHVPVASRSLKMVVHPSRAVGTQ